MSSLHGRWLRHGYLGQTRRPPRPAGGRVLELEPEPEPVGQMYYLGDIIMRYTDLIAMSYV